MATSTLPAPSGPFTDASSMTAGIPADIMDAFATPPTVDAPSDAPADDVIDDSPADTPAEDAAPVDATTPVIDEPPADDEPAAEPTEDEPSAAQPARETPADEALEDGITKGKNKAGKEGYFLENNRYKNVYQNHQLVQQATERLGEPLTLDKLETLNAAFLGQERLFNNLASADPASQGDVVNFLLSEMKGAQEAGEVGADPTIPFAETVYTALRDQSPEGYATLRFMGAKDFIGEMFDHAARTGDQALYNSAMHFGRALAGIGPKAPDVTDAQYAQHVREVTGRSGIPFHLPDEAEGLVRGEDPATQLARENAELRAQLNGRSQTSTTEQFKTWDQTTRQGVNKAILDTVKPALVSAEAAWKQFPTDYNDLVVDRLNRLVSQDVAGDAVLNQRANELNEQARRATSPQVRQRIGEQIKDLFSNRAKIAVAKHSPAVLKFAAESLKGRSDATHDRRAGAQTRTVPKGPSAPVQRSIMPEMPAFKNGTYDSTTAYKQAQRMLAALSR